MALIAIDPEATIDYSLLSDTGPDKTVFKLGTIDAFVRAYLDDTHINIRKGDTVDINDVAFNHKLLEIVRFGLKGWTNFKDADGKDVPFVTEDIAVPNVGRRMAVSEDSMKHLSFSWVIELAVKINDHNSLKEADLKNS